ncbi:S-layer homology domain-containing protein [Salimicrobium sp. PL1-032A]|uniref:S-layer homology domain-containing protein n=1 Tax=Salimicrobium sp. PL1-032A TaxID=3095364 RepID=UPI003260070C
MKKFIIMFLGAVLIATLLVPSVHAEDDITGTPFEEEMRSLIDKGVIEGYPDGTYRPDARVTRAQFTAFVIRALDIPMTDEVLKNLQASEENHFNDVPPTEWYYPYTTVGSSEGLINGHPDGSFSPNTFISRQNLAMIIMNAAELKGVVTEAPPLDFEDNDEIRNYAKQAVRQLIGLGITYGKAIDGKTYFAPEDLTTRGEASAFIDRFLNVLNPPEEEYKYSVASIQKDADPEIHGKYESFDTAVANTSGNQVVLKGSNIVWIDEGMAVSNSFTSIYETKELKSSGSLTYFTSGTEVELLDIEEEVVKVRIAETTGFLSTDKVNLIPEHMIEGRSYYYTKNGNLYHHKYNTIRETGHSYQYGKAPSFMEDGNKYYSYDGATFTDGSGEKVGEAYQYFNRMPLYSDTSYTAEQLDEFIASERPDSPLIGTGDDFKKAEAEHGTNALYLMAHAIHESNWGTSRIAQDKNNLFGIGAVDGTPYESAYEYGSFETGILEAAEQFIVPGYFENTWKSYGAHLGNKSTGMNVFYASDPYWGQKIAGYMYRADSYLSKAHHSAPEYAAYPLAETLKPDTNVRDQATAKGSTVHYALGKPGSTVQILDSVSTSGEAVWYSITPKDYTVQKDGDTATVTPVTHGKAYVYSHGGTYGTNLEKINIAE